MLMRVFKLVLIFILFLCGTWTLMIVAGPKAVEYIVKQKFGDTVELSKLEISPKLELKAALINFKEFQIDGVGSVSGFARGVEMKFDSILNSEPLLEVSVGPTFFDDMVSFERIKLVSSLGEVFRLGDIDFKIELSNLDFFDIGKISAIVVDGTFNYKETTLRDLRYNGSGSELNSKYLIQNFATSADIEELNGSIDLWTLKKPIASHDFNVEMVFVDPKLPELGVAAKRVKYVGVLGQKSTAGLVELSSLKSDSGHLLDILKLNLDLKNESNDLRGNIFYDVAGVSVPDYYFLENLLLDNAAGYVRLHSGDEVHYGINGILRSFVLTNGSGYIADLSESSFALEGEFLKKKASQASFNVETGLEPRLILKGNAQVTFAQDLKFGCLLTGCMMNSLSAGYALSAGEASLFGSSRCSNKDCLNRRIRHEVSTDNTADFFKELSKSKVINPFVVAYIYNQFLGSRNTGKGHIINF